MQYCQDVTQMENAVSKSKDALAESDKVMFKKRLQRSPTKQIPRMMTSD